MINITIFFAKDDAHLISQVKVYRVKPISLLLPFIHSLDAYVQDTVFIDVFRLQACNDKPRTAIS